MKMRKCISIVLIMTLMAALIPNLAYATEASDNVFFAGGDGTASNPYLVSTPEQLDAVRQDLSAHYRQISDIDLSGFESWKPIGTALSMETAFVEHPDPEPFTGSFDGGNYEISGMRIDSAEASVFFDCIGLFAGASQAKLSNIHLTNLSIYAYRGDDDYENNLSEVGAVGLYIGGICAKSENTEFMNCSVSGQIQVSEGCDSYVGGIIGKDYFGSVSDCISEVLINVQANRPIRYQHNSDAYAGGIVGRGEYSHISGCTNLRSIHVKAGNSSYVGGICGEMHEGRLLNCVNLALVRGEVDEAAIYDSAYWTAVGGIAGMVSLGSTEYQYGHYPQVELQCCVNFGDVHSQTRGKSRYTTAYAGGIIGMCQNLAFENGYSSLDALVNLAQNITSATMTDDHVLENLSDCGTICGRGGRLLFGQGVSLDTTLCGGALVDDGDFIPEEYQKRMDNAANGQKRTAQQLQQKECYPRFDFDRIWTMDDSIGGPMLLSALQLGLQQLKVEVTITKVMENVYESPIEGAYQYEIVARFENTSESELTEVVTELFVGEGLSMAEGENTKFSLGHFEPGRIAWAKWKVNVPWTRDKGNATFQIVTTIDGSGLIEKDEVIALSHPTTYTDIHGWPIINWKKSFGYGKDFEIPIERYSELYGFTITKLFRGVVEVSVNDSWPGNCFGMSLLTLGEYFQKVDLSSWFTSDEKYLHDFGFEGIQTNDKGEQWYTLEGNDTVIQMIERAQIAMFSKELKDVEQFINDPHYEQLLDFLSSNDARPLLVAMNDKDGSHAVVVTTDFPPYLIPEGEMKGWYVLPLYDPNIPSDHGGLSNPVSLYNYESSLLLLNTETTEWAYYSENKYKLCHRYYEIVPQKVKNSLQSIDFYDVAMLPKDFFLEGILNLPSDQTQIYSSAPNLKVVDMDGAVLIALENGQVTEQSDCCEITWETGAAEVSNSSYMIGLDAAQVRIASDDAAITLLQGEKMYIMELDGMYSVVANRDNEEVGIESRSDGEDFVLYTQDKAGHAAKITAQHLKNNRLTIIHEGSAIRIKTRNKDANISYECENMSREDVSIQLVSVNRKVEEKKDQNTEQEPEIWLFVVIATGVLVLAGAVIAALIIKKKYHA